jgi:probable HAF family extracellular repeat protein
MLHSQTATRRTTISALRSLVAALLLLLTAPLHAAPAQPAGDMIGLGFLPGGTLSVAYAVSADGSVVVGYNDSVIPNISVKRQAFRWTQSGGMVSIGFLPNGVDSIAHSVSADGSVVVGVSHISSGAQAFRWTQSGGMVAWAPLPATSIATRWACPPMVP